MKLSDRLLHFLILLLIVGLAPFNMAVAGTLSGHVTDHDTGAPLWEIPVQLYQSADPNFAGKGAWDYVGVTYTDQTGAYAFSNLDERQYHVSVYTGVQDFTGTHYVEADLYNIQVFAAAETPNMDLALRQAGYIWGRVTANDGTPIPYAQVVAHGSWTDNGNDWHQVQADFNGNYYLWLLPSPGNFYRIDSLNAYLAGVQYEAQIAPGLYQASLAGVHGPDFTLAEGGCIAGRIVNEQGVGIPQVELDPAIGFLDDPDVRTDANGYYVLTNLPATNAAFAYIDYWFPVVFNGVKYGSGENFVGPFSIVPNSGCAQAPDMVMAVAGTIEGVITDEGGTPVVGVEVDVEGFDLNGYAAYHDKIYTDAFGQYTIDHLAPGTYTVRTAKEGWVPATRSGVVVSSSELTDVDFGIQQASQGAMISGQVTNYSSITCNRDSSGVLLPNYIQNDFPDGCNVGIVAFPGDITYRDQDVLDIGANIIGFGDVFDGYSDYFEINPAETTGNYAMALPPGVVDAVLYESFDNNNGGYVLLYDYKRWQLSAGQVLANENFVLPIISGTGSLTGQITVPAGAKFNPQRTLIIATLQGNDTNFALGDAIANPRFAPEYRINHLPVGTYNIRAISDGFVTQTYEGVVVSNAATTTRDINLSLGAALSGVITDSVSGTPVNGARVEIVENGKDAVSDSSGHYAINGIAPGEYNITASKPGYAVFTATQSINAPTTLLDISLIANTGSISGQVEDSSGTSINGATVVAYNPALNSYKTGTTIGGNFTITDLVAGDYVLGINVTGYDVTVYPSTGLLTLNPNQALTITDPIVISASPPLFSSSSTVSESGGVTTLSVTIMSDQALLSDPVINSSGLVTPQGCGTLNWVQNDSMQWTVTCEVNSSESLVIIHVAEGSTPVIPGNPAADDFSFEVQQNLLSTSSTNFYNAIGGESTIMGTQDNTQVYVPPFALTGADTTAVTLTVQRYGNPGDAVTGTNNTSASAVYDFSFGQEGVGIDVNHTATVTLQFEKPDSMTQAEFEANLKIGYFRVTDQQWVYQDDPDSGISNVHINWLNNTITFDVNHFTRFAAFLPPAEILPGDIDNDGDVDRDDLNILLLDRNKSVADSSCGSACDLDGDGVITALDARKLVLLCTRPRCATE